MMIKNSFFIFGLWTFALLIIFAIPTSPQQPQKNNSLIDEIDLLFRKEDYQKAAQTIESMLINTPGTAELYYKLGLAYQKQYLYDKAIDDYSKSVKLDSNLTPSYLSMGDCFTELGAPKKAFSIYEKIFASDSTNIKAGFKLASTLTDLQNFRYAFDVYNKILKTDSNNSYIYRQLGYCAQKLDTIQLSIRYYNTALRLNNNDMISLQQVINNYIKLKWNGAAFYNLLQRAEKDPENPIVNRLLGDVFFNDRQYVKALEYYSKALRPGDTTVYFLQKMGISYYLNASSLDSSEIKKKDISYRLAAETLEKSLELEYNPVAYYFLAEAKQKMGNYLEAINYFNKALDIIMPGFLPELYLHLSQCYSALNDYPQMINSYKGALLFNPDNSALLLNIAEVYEKGLSDYSSAIKYYKEYLEKDTLDNEVTTRVKQKINKLNKNN